MSSSRIAVLIALAVVLGLCFYFVNFRKKNNSQSAAPILKHAWWRRLAPFSSGSDQLKIIATVSLTNRATLHEIQWHEKRILLVSGELGVAKLDEAPVLISNESNRVHQSGAD